MQYALDKDIPVAFMDLPVAHQLAWTEEEAQLKLRLDTTAPAGGRELRADPLGYLARLAGQEDGERWWEQTFEQWEEMDGVFPLLLELMTQLREKASYETEETLLREAYMRKRIRKEKRAGRERLAVVCGAWHAPALARWVEIPAKRDNDLLKGMKKKKTEVAWVPWSYEQLARGRGYAAGVVSPAWYELLFSRRQEVAVRWMSKAAQLFRKEGILLSSAHVIEAARLAETLTSLRGLPAPGLGELKEAALSVFCQGDTHWLGLIEEKLVVGDAIGKIGERAPKVPLQKDVEKRIRTARLGKYWESSETVTKELDLRKDNQLKTSHLLHALLLLNIPWGQEKRAAKGALGGFHEKWKLRWRPAYSLRVIEAAVYGSTVETAATRKAASLGAETEQLDELTDLIDRVLKADLAQAIPTLTQRLQAMAAQTQDVQRLMRSLPPLMRALRYGSTRKLDIQALQQVLGEILPRIFVGLPAAAAALDAEGSRDFFELISETHHYLQLGGTPADLSDWLRALQSAEDHREVHPYIRGGITRLLFDRQERSASETSDRLAFALSPAAEPGESAAWLEGFLQQSGLLLLHHPAMWRLLDDWVDALPADRFEQVLPLLRRAFAEIPRPERRKLLALAGKGREEVKERTKSEAQSLELPQALRQTLELLLG